MSVEPSAAPPGAAAPDTARIAPSPHLSPLLTIALTLIVIAYIVAWPVVLPLVGGRLAPLETLDEPGRALERLVEREMDLARALRDAPAWEWWLYTGGASPAAAMREAREWYEELLEVEDSPIARLEHAVLVGESGGAVGETLQDWAETAEHDERLQSWVRAAYNGPPPRAADGRAIIAEIDEGLEGGWFADQLAMRVAERIGDGDTARRAEAAIVRRGASLAARLRLLVACGFLLVAVGLCALCMLLRRPGPPVGAAPVPPAWPARDGWGLFVRGLGAPQALALAFFYVVRRETPFEPLVGMVADLALFAWVLLYLRRRGESPVATFGLAPLPGSGRRLALITFALIGLTVAGDILVDLVGPLLGLRVHWSDGFPEDLLWSPPGRVAIDTFDAVVWAPVVEEITFRGLLYATVRTRLGMLPAAALSAAVFTLPHDYGVAGSLSVFWSGLLWALAYERTKSLLPGILAHSANNLISTAWALVTLRL